MAFGEKKPLEIPNMGNFILGPETSTNFESGWLSIVDDDTKKNTLQKNAWKSLTPPRGLI